LEKNEPGGQPQQSKGSHKSNWNLSEGGGSFTWPLGLGKEKKPTWAPLVRKIAYHTDRGLDKRARRKRKHSAAESILLTIKDTERGGKSHTITGTHHSHWKKSHEKEESTCSLGKTNSGMKRGK